LIAALFVATVLWATAARHESERQEGQGRAETELRRLVQGAEAALNRSLLQVDLTLAGLGETLRPARPQDAAPDVAAVQRLMRTLVGQNLLIRELVVLAPDGRVLVSAHDSAQRLGLALPDGFLASVFMQPYAAMSASVPAISHSSGELVLYLARPLTLPQGGRAAVVAEVPISLIATILTQAAGIDGLTLTLERGDGVLLAAVPSNEARLGERLSPPLRAPEADGTPRRLSGRTDGQPSLLATRPTLYASLIVSVGVAERAVHAAALAKHEDEWIASGIYSAFALLLAALLHWHLSGLVAARAQTEQGRLELQTAHDELRLQVAARERSDAERDATQRLMAGLLQSTHEGFWFVGPDRRTLDVNPAMCRLLGRPRDEIIGRDIYAFVDETNAAIIRRGVAALAQGRACAYELSLLLPDGSVSECINNATPIHDAQGHWIGSVGMLTDVSEMKASQRELGRAKATLDQALDAMRDGFTIVDAEQRLVVWNRHYLELFPFLRDVVAVGVPMSLILKVAGQALLPADASDEQRRDLVRWRMESLSVTGDFEKTLPGGLSVQYSSSRTPDGSVVSLYRDISDAKATQQALLAARDEAERANAAKDDFLSHMSHELRTPLNAVLGFAQLLQLPGGPPLNAQQAEHVRHIRHGGEHLLQLVNEVLDLARIESGRLEVSPEPVALQPVIERCAAQIDALARQRRIGVTLRPGEAKKVLADPLRLQQVLLNLLSNAVKYNREGGSIEINSVLVAGQCVRISVRDRGQGLSAEQQARLFRPFERLESAHSGIEGTGIGLALAKRLVEGMHGAIGVDSVLGEGSTFWFELPLCDVPAPTDTSAPAAGAGVSPRGGKRTVLYVEDNPANQRLMQKILSKRADLELLVASDAEEGLVLAARARPDLMLLDINLPGMDGFEALQRLRSDPATRAIPVIAVTSNAMPRDIKRGMAAGFSDYVTKPIDVAGFLETLGRRLPGRKEDEV